MVGKNWVGRRGAQTDGLGKRISSVRLGAQDGVDSKRAYVSSRRLLPSFEAIYTTWRFGTASDGVRG